MEILRDIEDLLSFQRNGAAAPFVHFSDGLRLGIALEAAHEVAPVLVDPGKAAKLEVRQIEDQQPSAEPRSRLGLGAVVGTFACDGELLDDSVSNIVEQMKLRSSLLLSAALILLTQEPM